MVRTLGLNPDGRGSVCLHVLLLPPTVHRHRSIHQQWPLRPVEGLGHPRTQKRGFKLLLRSGSDRQSAKNRARVLEHCRPLQRSRWWGQHPNHHGGGGKIPTIVVVGATSRPAQWGGATAEPEPAEGTLGSSMKTGHLMDSGVLQVLSHLWKGGFEVLAFKAAFLLLTA